MSRTPHAVVECQDVEPRLTTTTAGSTAGDIMTTPVITVAPETSVGEVAETLRRHRVSGVPVVDAAGTVLGLVSEYDLLAKTGALAGDVMVTALITVSSETAISDVRHLLVDRRIRRVPVLDAGRLVGIVSRSDVIALMATEWVCGVCGEPVRAERRPEMCPKCHAAGEQFRLQEQVPGD
jgi:CBS domain-containing protein